ncbi:MAG: peptide deformylase [bacterium]
MNDDPRLRQVAKKVRAVDDTIRALITDMIETMKENNGIGLAAPQVGVPLRVFVVGVGETPIVMVNPSMVRYAGEDVDVEGCLSLPGLLASVRRYQKVRFRGLDAQGRKITIDAEDLPARVLQHELDHLDGMLITDRAEPGTVRTVERDEKGEPLEAVPLE